MPKLRVYADTSVIGGCLDTEFKDDSLTLFNEFRDGKKLLVVSDLVLFELDLAPQHVKNILKKVPETNIEYISLSEEALELSGKYIKDGVIAERSISDARHIAMATIERVDVLASWNFKHIVNLNRIHLINSVNLKLGYQLIEIRSPKEVIDNDKYEKI